MSTHTVDRQWRLVDWSTHPQLLSAHRKHTSDRDCYAASQQSRQHRNVQFACYTLHAVIFNSVIFCVLHSSAIAASRHKLQRWRAAADTLESEQPLRVAPVVHQDTTGKTGKTVTAQVHPQTERTIDQRGCCTRDQQRRTPIVLGRARPTIQRKSSQMSP